MQQDYLSGVRQLVRQNVITHTDWVKLIEARRQLIEPHLKSMELKPIGKVKVMGFSNEDSCLIENGAPEVVASSSNLSLDTRCYYPMGDSFYRDTIIHTTEFEYRPPGSSPAVGGCERFWALTRAGTWVVVAATVQFPQTHHRPTGYPIERARVSKVVLTESSVSDVILQAKTTPEDIWVQLGKLAREWYDRREELLWDAKRLAETFDLEDKIFAHIRK